MKPARAPISAVGSPRAERASARAELIAARIPAGVVARLFAQAAESKSVRQRVLWLRRAADTVSDAARATGATPCQPGCAHCCHLPVVLTRAEAQAIAAAEPAAARRFDSDAGVQLPLGASSAQFAFAAERRRDAAMRQYLGQPCPFLQGGACAIYPNRPLACRWHISLDDDAGSCVLTTGAAPLVPYFDSMEQQIAATAILGVNQPFADVRDWFNG